MKVSESPPSAESTGSLHPVDPDLEREFIIEFATGGALPIGLSVVDRRERIRLAIYTQQRAHLLFRDGPMTYTEAYAKCFGRPLEMRRTVRPDPKNLRQ